MLFKDFMEMFNYDTTFRITCYEQGEFDDEIDPSQKFIYKGNTNWPAYMEFRMEGNVEYLDGLVLDGKVEWVGIYDNALCVCITYGELPC